MVPIDNPTLDIRLDVSNSCNCFQWCKIFRRSRSDTNVLMYVNKDGVAVKFDPQKAIDESVALKKSVDNLHKFIEAVAIWNETSINELRSKIEKETGLPTDPKDPPRITLGLIQRINKAIESFFKEEPKASTSKT